MKLTGSGDLGVKFFNVFMGQIKGSYPNVPEEFWERFQGKINADTLETMIIPIYSKYFSDSDLDQIIKFYSTPAGKKVIE